MEPSNVKKPFLTAYLLIMGFVLWGQERLSDIHNNLHSHYETSYEWNGTRYLISILNTEEVRIFQLKGPDDARLIFEQKMTGVFAFSESTRFYGEWMIFQDGTHQHTLHLTQKKLYTFKRPDGFYSYAESMFYDLDYCLLKLEEKATGYELFYLLDYDKGIERWNGEYGTPLCRNGHEFVCHSFEGPAGAATSRYDVINVKTGEKKLIVKNLSYQPTFNFSEGNFWYVDKGIPIKYDPIDKSLTKFPTAKLSFYSTTSIHVKDNYLIVMGSQIDNYHVLTYDLKKEKLLSTSKGVAPAAGFMTQKVRLFKQYMLCFDAGYHMHQFDYEKGFVRKYKVVFDPYFISNRIPTLHEGEDYVFNGKGYTYVNFATTDTSFIPVNAPVLTSSTYDFASFHFEDDRVLVVTMSRHRRTSVQFIIDPIQKTAEPVNLTLAPRGMNQDSKILKVDSILYLYSDALYRIKGDELIRLPSQVTGLGNTFNASYNSNQQYKKRDDALESYVLEDGQLIVYQHLADQSIRCGQIPFQSNIYEACCFANKIYTLEYQNGYQICQYDSSGLNRKVIDKFSISNSINHIQITNEFSYLILGAGGVMYLRDSVFYVAHSDGTSTRAESSPSFKGNVFQMQNQEQKYFFSNYQKKAMHVLEGKTWNTLFQDINYLRNSYIDTKRNKAAFSLSETSDFSIQLTDGKAVKKWTTPSIAAQVGVEGKYILYRIGKDKPAYLLDLESEKLLEIPPLPEGYQYGALTITQKDTLFYGYTGTSFDYTVRMYRMSNHFNQLSQIEEYKIPANVNYLYAEGEGNTRWVYSSLFTKQLNSNAQLESRDELLMGNNLTTPPNFANNHFVNNGYLYFLAADKTKGKQLYRLKMEYTPTSVETTPTERAIVYPNPVSEFLHLQHPRLTEKKEGICSIYQVSGNLIAVKPYKDAIDIRDLKSGYYLAVYTCDDLQIPFSFIKI